MIDNDKRSSSSIAEELRPAKWRNPPEPCDGEIDQPPARGSSARCARAFLHTETDGNDLTYFIVHQIKVILRAFEDLDAYIERKAAETREHRTSHAVAYATARADLLRLAALGLLDRGRIGKKTNVFLAPPDLEDRIRSLPGDA